MESKQQAIWAVLFVTFALATLTLGLRLFSRMLKKAPFWWDDYFAIGCYAFAVAWLIDIPIWLSKGLGRHITDLTWWTVKQATSQSKLCNYVAELIYACALYCAKMSILAFYCRVFGHTNVRILIQILSVVSTIWWIIRLFLGIFRCNPPRAFWDFSVSDANCNTVDQKFFFAIVSIHLAIDVLILLLPIFKISHMNLGKVQRMGAIAMFMFGIIVCAAAAGVIASTVSFDPSSEDLTWNIADFVIWATVEVNLVSVSASFPMIRPAFKHLFGCFLPQYIINSSSNGGYGSNAARDGLYNRSKVKQKSIKLSTLPKRRSIDEEYLRGSEFSSVYEANHGGAVSNGELPSTELVGDDRG